MVEYWQFYFHLIQLNKFYVYLLWLYPLCSLQGLARSKIWAYQMNEWKLNSISLKCSRTQAGIPASGWFSSSVSGVLQACVTWMHFWPSPDDCFPLLFWRSATLSSPLPCQHLVVTKWEVHPAVRLDPPALLPFASAELGFCNCVQTSANGSGHWCFSSSCVDDSAVGPSWGREPLPLLSHVTRSPTARLLGSGGVRA